MPKKNAETKPEAAPAKLEETPTSQQPPGSLEGTPVVTMPKYNPYYRPAATEQVGTTPIRQSYEVVQAEAKGPGVEEWRTTDKARADLSATYQSLKDDPRYSEEYKSEQAWRQYEKVRAQVEQLAPEARQKMLRSADSLERMSIPTPEHESLITQDTNKLLLTAHERNRLEGLLDRAEKQAERGPFKRDPHDILKAEYARGLDEAGPAGGATARAVYQLARDRGLDIHAIVDEHRRPSHRGALEDAERALMRANMVGKSVPEPPFPHPRSSQSRDVGSYGQGRRTFTGGSGAPAGEASSAKRKPGASQGRRPYWK